MLAANQAARLEQRLEPDPVAAGSGSSPVAIPSRDRGDRAAIRSVLLDRDAGLGPALDGLEHHAVFVGEFGKLI